MNPQELEMYLQSMGGMGNMDGMGAMMRRPMMRRPMPPNMQNMLRSGSLLGNSQLPAQLNNIPIEQVLAQVVGASGGGGNGGGGGGGGFGGMPMPPPRQVPPVPMMPRPAMPPPQVRYNPPPQRRV